jgi:Flp pilus assembly protein TadG
VIASDGSDAARIRARTRNRASRPDDGFAALELAILAPVLIAMLLLVVGLGRVSQGRQTINQAGAAGARAAALTSTPGQAVRQAQQAAADTLVQAGVSCGQLGVEVDTSAFGPGGYVQVSVRCTSDLSGLAIAGLPGSVTLTATSRSPLETLRQLEPVRP